MLCRPRVKIGICGLHYSTTPVIPSCFICFSVNPYFPFEIFNFNNTHLFPFCNPFMDYVQNQGQIIKVEMNIVMHSYKKKLTILFDSQVCNTQSYTKSTLYRNFHVMPLPTTTLNSHDHCLQYHPDLYNTWYIQGCRKGFRNFSGKFRLQQLGHYLTW